jgi:hypothetical protein
VSEEEREYLNETIRNLNNQLVDALRERDEARREVCKWNSTSYPHDTKEAYEIAAVRGWDCFNDKNEADTNNTLFRTTDGE